MESCGRQNCDASSGLMVCHSEGAMGGIQRRGVYNLTVGVQGTRDKSDLSNINLTSLGSSPNPTLKPGEMIALICVLYITQFS